MKSHSLSTQRGGRTDSACAARETSRPSQAGSRCFLGSATAPRPLTIGLVALVLLLAGACSSAPPITSYSLILPGERSLAIDSGIAGPRIAIASFEVEAPYDQTRLVYRKSSSSHQVGTYQYHRWAEPLGEQLAAVVATVLNGQLADVRFEPEQRGVPYGGYLGGRLTELVEVTTSTGVEVRAGLVLWLEDSSANALWSGRVSANRSGTPAEVEQLVALMRSTLETALAEARGPLLESLQALDTTSEPD